MNKIILLAVPLIALLFLSGCVDEKGSREEFRSCMSDGRYEWSNSEQKCYLKETEDEGYCKDIDWMDEINNLPRTIERRGRIRDIGDCSMDEINFECNGLTFIPFSILEDEPKEACESGFDIGTHSDYGYKDVHYLGKNETSENFISTYEDPILISYTPEACGIAYYRVEVTDLDIMNHGELITLCW